MSYEIRNDKLLREAYEAGRWQGLNELSPLNLPGTNVNIPKSGIGVERQTGNQPGNQKDYPHTCPPVGWCGEWGVPGEGALDGLGNRFRWNGKKWIHVPWGKDESHLLGGGGIGGIGGGGGMGGGIG
jgi:hypothetical protein